MAALRKSRWGTAALVAVFALFLVVAAAVRLVPRGEPAQTPMARPAPAPAEAACAATQPDTPDAPAARGEEATALEDTPADGGDEDGEERLVDDFHAETDRWTAANGSGAKMPAVEDASAFAEKFRALPGGRKEECLQRALNLVPDENVMVLVGILMDKTQDRELVQLVFNDILNRPDDVKKPILERILSDRGHPCNADARWISEATGGPAQDL